MAIKHITGVPGTGKTYFAINDVILRYYRFDDKLVEWVIDTEKLPKRDVVIFTNIDNLKLTHINIDDYCSQHNITIYEFFTTGYWENNLDYKNHQYVVILDEAQKYFPSSYRLAGTPSPDKNPFFWFQYHRHYGVDVYVITQTYDSISRHVVQLAEYEIHAITPVYRLGNNFRYVFRTGITPDAIIARKSIKYDRRVGMLYQSFMADSDDSSRPNPLKKLILFLVVLIALAVYFFYSSVSSIDSAPAHHEPPTPAVRDARARVVPHAKKLAHQSDEKAKKTTDLTPSKTVMFSCGGIWTGRRLRAIDFFGDLIPISDFNLPYINHPDQFKVSVFVRQDILDTVQIAALNRYYQDIDNATWRDVGQGQAQDGQSGYVPEEQRAERAKILDKGRTHYLGRG